MFVLEQYHCKAIKGTGAPERGKGRGEEIVLCSAGRGGSAAEAHRRCLFVLDVCLHVWPFISGNRSSKQLRAHKKMRRHILQHHFFLFLYNYIHIHIATQCFCGKPPGNKSSFLGFYMFSLSLPFVLILLVVVSKFVFYLLKGAVERKRDWSTELTSFLIRQETPEQQLKSEGTISSPGRREQKCNPSI